MKRLIAAWVLIGAWAFPASAAEPAPLPPLDSPEPTPAPTLTEQYLGCEDCGEKPGLIRSLFRKSDPACRPEKSAYSHLFVPFAVSLRTGPGFIVGGGRLADVLDTGYAVELGAKGFLYDFDQSAAWTGTLGLDYTYNNAHDPTASLLAGEPATLRELHRISARVSVGREWYFSSGEPGAPTWAFGADFGGRLGHAHAQFNELGREHQTDVLYGLFLGADADLLIPRRGYDIVFGGRFEWGHEWFDVIDDSDNLGHIKLMLKVGLRY